jgi:hypothetical protein
MVMDAVRESRYWGVRVCADRNSPVKSLRDSWIYELKAYWDRNQVGP